MTEGGSDWAAQRMAEFLSQVTSFETGTSAELKAIERIGETLDAEVVAIVRGNEISSSIGFPRNRVPLAGLLALAKGEDATPADPSLSGMTTTVLPLEEIDDTLLVVGRVGANEFTPRDLNLLRGMARVLTLGLRMISSVEVERKIREQSERQAKQLERQAAELTERHRLFERLSKIQRSMSHRASLQDVFDSITSSASELLAEPDAIVGLRLIDRDDPTSMVMVASTGVPDDLRDGLVRTPIGQGVGGLAVTREELVIVENYSDSDVGLPPFFRHVSAAMATPVYEQGEVVGSLAFASRRKDRRFTSNEQEILRAFAQHASLALRDAREAQELRASFSESLSGISAKAAREKRELVEQLHQAQKMEAVGRLAGGVAHDFNNVLMVIQTSAMLLQESLDESHEGRMDVEEIIAAADRASRLVRQLLTFSRKEVPQTKTLDVERGLKGMSELLRRAVGSHIPLEIAIEGESCCVRLDPTHLEQVLINLAVNARDAMPEGGTLTIRAGRQMIEKDHVLPPGSYVVIEVTDSGTGIETEVLSHLFEPFFTTKEQGKGTGLGLATVYGIVSGAGGTIDVESELGKGTTFRILLPAADDPEADWSDGTGGEDRSATEDGKSLRILVVDDEESIRELVRRVLTRHGHEVEAARSGREALDLMTRDAPFDLVLSDIVMAEMTGIELLTALRVAGIQCPFVLMSGYADARVADPGIVENASAFIEKPFKEGQLLEVLSSVMLASTSR